MKIRLGHAASAALLMVCCNAIIGNNEDLSIQAGSGGNSGGSTSTGGTTPSGGTSGGVGATGGVVADANDGASGKDAKDADAPKLIACGNSDCSVESGYCCVTNSGGNLESKCWAQGVSCTGLDVGCDGPEDCVGEAGPGICCADPGTGGKPVHIKCQSSCPAGDVVVCGTSSTACPSGTTCQPSPDYPDYGLCL